MKNMVRKKVSCFSCGGVGYYWRISLGITVRPQPVRHEPCKYCGGKGYQWS